MEYTCFYSGSEIVEFGELIMQVDSIEREGGPETIVKLGSCSSLLKTLNSTLKVSIQKQKEQSWR